MLRRRRTSHPLTAGSIVPASTQRGHPGEEQEVLSLVTCTGLDVTHQRLPAQAHTTGLGVVARSRAHGQSLSTLANKVSPPVRPVGGRLRRPHGRHRAGRAVRRRHPAAHRGSSPPPHSASLEWWDPHPAASARTAPTSPRSVRIGGECRVPPAERVPGSRTAIRRRSRKVPVIGWYASGMRRPVQAAVRPRLAPAIRRISSTVSGSIHAQLEPIPCAPHGARRQEAVSCIPSRTPRGNQLRWASGR
jgi:hypothetical protein